MEPISNPNAASHINFIEQPRPEQFEDIIREADLNAESEQSLQERINVMLANFRRELFERTVSDFNRVAIGAMGLANQVRQVAREPIQNIEEQQYESEPESDEEDDLPPLGADPVRDPEIDEG